MPFDNARHREFEAPDQPDGAAMERAITGFDAAHPYLLFDAAALPAIRRRAVENRELRLRFAQSLSETSHSDAAVAPRAMIKRRARRLIVTAFTALTAQPPTAKLALAATRQALAEFAAAPNWRERSVIRSFLDCAEIAVAVSLAYDWLYDELTPCERGSIEAAIRRNVLEPALTAYQDRSLLWPRRRDNCAIVSNSGILVAALAVLRQDRELSAALAHQCLMSAWNVLWGMAPDGAWREGLSYWSLAMRYASFMVAVLESMFGDSYGLADRPGFAQTGDFALHAVGPFGAAFNFGDSEQGYDASPLAWFAHRFGRSVDGWLLGDGKGWHLPFAAIWPSRERASPMTLGLPTGKVFRSGDLACFRNTWSCAPAARPVYLAIKGGNVSPAAAGAAPAPEDIILHAQADAGTFIVDGARHRWVVDMGSDDYDLPGYFEHGADARSGRRWQYYRLQAAGHNTLTIGGHGQIPNTPAAIIADNVEGDSKWVVLDLSAAYGQPPGTIRRGAALLGREVVIQDEIEPGLAGQIVWTAHTSAEPVSLAGSLARFRAGEDNFIARVVEPAGARFELTFPPPPRSFAPLDTRKMHGRLDGDDRPVCELPRRMDEAGQRAAGALIRRLQIVLPAGTQRVTVLLLPDGDGSELALPVAPLDRWLARHPVRLIGIPRRGCRAPGRPVRCMKSNGGYDRVPRRAGLENA